MTTYFTSDWHLWHSSIIEYAKRPYIDVKEMNQTILDMFNATVKKGDVVYFLGDFAFSNKSRIENITDVIKKLSDLTEFHCILGNHDYSIREIFERYCTSVSPLKVVSVKGQKITLCHFPMHSYSGSHHNNWQLYGHHHYDTNKEIPGKRFNVCLEANNYHMISFEQLQEIMKDGENNWDYITPERKEREKKYRKLVIEISNAESVLHRLEEKVTKNFLENAPEKFVKDTQTKIAKYKQRIKEMKDELTKYST